MTADISRLFSQRAALYRRLDAQLAARTRFFGAAALINAALAELYARPWARWYVGDAGSLLLLQVGGRLERVNVRLAERLSAAPWALGGHCGPRLDRAIVMVEQRQVQRLLHEMRMTDACAHRRALRRIDRLLCWAVRAAERPPDRPRAACPMASHVVCSALRAVRAQLGRAVSFAFYADRESIGWILVGRVRSGVTPPG